MSRILLVHSCQKANSAVFLHYLYYLQSGCERVVGILTEGGRCKWPTEDTVAISPDRYIDGPHLPNRLLRTLEFGLAQGADEIVVIEYDVLFFHPLPAVLPKGITMNWTGGNQPGFKCTRFAHVPWTMDAETAKLVIAEGDKMLAEGDIEGGNPDLFLGRLTDRRPDIPVHSGLYPSFTRNSYDIPGDLEKARAAVKAGAVVCHGIKHEREMTFILAP